MKILITSGGTKIQIDGVRHIANMSSGTFGSKIATEALLAGHHVRFFKAENSKSPFQIRMNLLEEKNALLKLSRIQDLLAVYGSNYTETNYSDFYTYMHELEMEIKAYVPDIIILAAAVSDYGVVNVVDGKIRSKESDMVIKLKALPKIISKVKEWAPTAYLVGFKLLVDSTQEELIENANKSITQNGCDMVVANDLRDIKNNAHQIIVVKPNKEPRMYMSTFPGTENYCAQAVIMEAVKGRTNT